MEVFVLSDNSTSIVSLSAIRLTPSIWLAVSTGIVTSGSPSRHQKRKFLVIPGNHPAPRTLLPSNLVSVARLYMITAEAPAFKSQLAVSYRIYLLSIHRLYNKVAIAIFYKSNNTCRVYKVSSLASTALMSVCG